MLPVLLCLAIGGCTGVDTTPDDDGPPAAGLAREFEELKARIDTLERDRDSLAGELAACRAARVELEGRIAALRREIAGLRERAESAPQRRIDELTGELAAARERLAGQRETNAQLRDEMAAAAAELEATREQFDVAREAYDARLESMSHSLHAMREQDAGAAALLVDLAPADTPTVVSLFYATNRGRLERGLWDAFAPFVPAVVSLGLLFLVPWAARRYLKEKYQRRTVIAAAIVFGASTVVLLVIAIQQTVQTGAAGSRLAVQYGNLRLTERIDGAPYELGICEVSIPPSHVPGEVELPSLTRFEFVADPSKHFVLQSISPFAESNDFYTSLKDRVSRSADEDLFVFVHGFHNTFEDAAFRTAQIVHDLGFDGAPVFFSWPSQGRLLDYQTDENNVGEAIEDLRHFLQALHDRSGAKRIHLIAHSMGSRALANAIMRLDASYRDGNVFNEAVFAAPDIDAETLGQIATDMTRIVERVTVYASSKDFALRLSRFLHGDTYQRAGETEPRPLVAPPVETIDVSRVSSGHAYIADTGRVLSDLRDIMKENRPLTDDVALAVPVGDDRQYWLMR